MSFHQIELGDKLKSIAVERYKASEGHKDVIAVVSKKIAAVHMHYQEGVGFFYCFQGKCCEDLGLPSVRYILPVLVYTLRDIRTRDYGMPLSLKYMALGKDVYESQILSKLEISQDLNMKDLLVTCTDEGWQKITIDVIGPNSWRDPKKGMVDTVKMLYDEYKRLISLSVARSITESKYVELCEKAAENPKKKDRVPSERQRSPSPDGSASLALRSSRPEADDLGVGSATSAITNGGGSVDLDGDLDAAAAIATPVAGATPHPGGATPSSTPADFDSLIDPTPVKKS